MNLFKELYGLVGQIVGWLLTFWDNVPPFVTDIYCTIFRQGLNLRHSILGAIPVPDVLANFTWPEIHSTVGIVLVQVGIPEALALIAAAYTLKTSIKMVALVIR